MDENVKAELTRLHEEQMKALKEMRDSHERGIKETADNANAAISAIQAQMDEVQKKAQRPAAGGAPVSAEKAEHAKAFSKYLRKGGNDDDLKALQIKAAVSVGSDPDGGFAVTEQLDTAIGQIERLASPMRQVCRVITVGNETYEKLFNVGGAAMEWVGETDARNETNTPQLKSVKPFFGEASAKPKVTQKALDDVFFNVEQWLGEEVGRAFAEGENTAFTTGSGTKQPKGVLSYTLAETADATRAFGTIEKYTTATQAVFIADELVTLIHKLKPGYRANAKWMMAGTTLAKVRLLKSNDNQYIWQPGLQAGQPSSLLGFPVVENESIPVVAAAANVAVFGDFARGYVIADVVGTRILRDPFSAKPYVEFYTTKRVGGGVEDSNALKVLTLKA